MILGITKGLDLPISGKPEQQVHALKLYVTLPFWARIASISNQPCWWSKGTRLGSEFMYMVSTNMEGEE